MRKTLLSLLILLGGCTAFAQTDNTFYAKGFAGTNVGFKVAAALVACNPNIQCFVVLDPSLGAFPDGTLPSIPANAHIIDYRGGLPYGNTGLTFLGAWSSTTSYGVNSVVTFNGASFVSLVSNLNVQPPSTPVSNSTWGLLLAPGSTSVSSINTATNVSFVPCAGTNDTAALNSALALAGHVIPTGFCNTTSHLTIFSNTHFDLSKAVISMTPSSPDYILINNAATQSAQRTFADAVVTAGSNNLSSATAAFNSTTDTGNSIDCLTAGDGTYDFHSYIASVTNGTTIVLADIPGATVNPATCSIFVRDNNISVTGGTLQFLGSGVSVGSADDIAKFKTVNNLRVDGTTFSDPSSTGAYQLHILDAANFSVQNVTLSSSQIHQDGVHICGPARDWVVAHVHGYVGDDMVAITARDTAFDTNDTSVFGTVQGWLIDDVSGSSNVAHGVTVISAPAAPIYDGKIRHVRGSQSSYPGGFSGLASAVLIADNNFYTGGWTGTQGLVSNISVEDVGGNLRGSGIEIQTSNGGDIDTTDAAGKVGYVGTGKILVQVNAGQVNALKVGRLRGVNSEGTQPLNIATGANVDQLQFGDIDYDGITAGGAYTFAQISGSVGDLVADKIQLKYNTTATNNGVFVVASGGSVTNFSLCHFHLGYQSGSTAAGKIISNSGTIGFLNWCDVSDSAPSLLGDTMLFNNSGATLGGYFLSGIQAQNISTCASLNGTVGSGTIIGVSMTGVTTPCANSLPNSLQLLSLGGSGTSTFAAGAAAGTSPGTPTCLVSHVCDSVSGVVDLTMGTATNNGTVLTISNPSGLTRTHQPACAGSAYLAASPYTAIPFRMISNTTSVSFSLGTAPTASTAYEFVYQCDGN